jgi:hypothetical protein
MIRPSNIVKRLAAAALLCLPAAARADEPRSFLQTIRRHSTVGSTVPDNGDTNPYAVVVAPVSSGKTGTTIVDFNPSDKSSTLFAQLPRTLPQCPGGVGLSTAMTMLKSGWIIVGSTPSTDGTTATKGNGALLILDSNGRFITAWSNPGINDPWGNIATADNGSTASIFVSMAGFDVPGPDTLDPSNGRPVVVKKAVVLRIDLSVPDGKPPVITNQTVVADGFGQRADRDAFLVGPTGLALSPDGTLFISDAVGNQIVAVPDALTRTTSSGAGRLVTRDGLLRRPLALVQAPNGHLLVCNATNGQLVELDPATGKQICAQWIDTDRAQSPPGNGDLFGLAMRPDGKAFYYVQDDQNALVEATP